MTTTKKSLLQFVVPETTIPVEPLSGREYVAFFQEHATRTTEYEAMLSLATKALSSLPNDNNSNTSKNGPISPPQKQQQHPRVLSIGAGDGRFDIDLFRRCQWTPSVYVAVEPLKNHAAQWRERCRAWVTRQKEESGVVCHAHLVNEPFSLRTSERIDFHQLVNGCEDRHKETNGGLFDVVLLSHCLYYLPDPMGVLEYCHDELLCDGGMIFIWTMTHEGYVYKLMERFGPCMSFVTPPPGDYSMTQASLMKMLQEWGLNDENGFVTKTFVEDSHLKIGLDDKQALDYLASFSLQTNIDKLGSDELLRRIRSFLESLVRNGELYHPSSLIVCKKVKN